MRLCFSVREKDDSIRGTDMGMRSGAADSVEQLSRIFETEKVPVTATPEGEAPIARKV